MCSTARRSARPATLPGNPSARAASDHSVTKGDRCEHCQYRHRDSHVQHRHPKRSSPSCAAVSPPRAGQARNSFRTPRRAYNWRRSRARTLLGDRARLAEGRGKAERPPAVQDRDRRARHPLHPRQVAPRGRAAADHHARLARLGDRAPRNRRPTDPTSHGGNAEDAFHLVLPSLPGYGLSDQPDELGWDPAASRAPGRSS